MDRHKSLIIHHGSRLQFKLPALPVPVGADVGGFLLGETGRRRRFSRQPREDGHSFPVIRIFTTRCCQIWHTGGGKKKTADSLNLPRSAGGREKRRSLGGVSSQRWGVAVTLPPCWLLSELWRCNKYSCMWTCFSLQFTGRTRLTLNVNSCNIGVLLKVKTAKKLQHQLYFRCLIVFFTDASAVWTEIFITFCLLLFKPLTVDSCGLIFVSCFFFAKGRVIFLSGYCLFFCNYLCGLIFWSYAKKLLNILKVTMWLNVRLFLTPYVNKCCSIMASSQVGLITSSQLYFIKIKATRSQQDWRV